jgi:hypothetical protein
MGSSQRSIAHMGALIVGAAYLVIGIVGFAVTGFGAVVQDTSDDILGFDLNPFHNFIHLAIGAYLLLVSRLSREAAEGALIGGGVVYLVAAFLGFDERLQILSISSADAADNFLHLASGAAAILIGVVSASVSHSKGSRDAVQQV